MNMFTRAFSSSKYTGEKKDTERKNERMAVPKSELAHFGFCRDLLAMKGYLLCSGLGESPSRLIMVRLSYRPICAVRAGTSIPTLVQARIGGIVTGVHADDNAGFVLVKDQVKPKTQCSLLPYQNNCPRFLDICRLCQS